MSKGLFVTATGTDVGKTYVSALLIKKMRKYGLHCGYYKAALSGAHSVAESDAGYVNQYAQIGQREDTLLSYLYKTPVSPHLAAQIEGNPVNLQKVQADYERVCSQFDYVVTEGSGGIVCPIRWDDEKILLEDIIKTIATPTLIVANAGLGTINATVLTVEYLKQRDIGISGIILNHYTNSEMEQDNMKMIEAITGVPVIACVKKGDETIDISLENLQRLFRKGEFN
ncbi:dethiobiotin synthase [Anaerotignum sp. MB30-C6]|uniref:dethiobiotin synthase n=1 Tax=Anaerotignum sp. MB30-C6 TaxID=3070814 RepID=UPI0027DEA384|nr:dethiobiotin synthase [Anaerotignum sp. MB30-C6]WMI79827.1 dethiobiotin synthase [Anaerotignum sp. MB30-C6]